MKKKQTNQGLPPRDFLVLTYDEEVEKAPDLHAGAQLPGGGAAPLDAVLQRVSRNRPQPRESSGRAAK